MKQILIDQTQITDTQIAEIPDAALSTGQARVRIDRFALTANNVTYAATGFIIGYWKFFPSGVEGKGLVPVWGFAEVVESLTDAIDVGDRLYGFWPMSEETVITPQRQGGQVVDMSAHRSELPPVYNRYTKVPMRDINEEGMQSLLQPLLATSWLLADWLEDNSYFDAKQIVVGSSSSKTGLGLCAFLAENPDKPVRVVGLTSDGNAEFVVNTGQCDSVITYDNLDALEKVPSVFVDMAGNAAVRAGVHSHFGDLLKHSSAVGTSHWDQFKAHQDLAGPKPQFFFAPSQIEKRREDWGPGVVERRIGEAWKRLAFGDVAWLDLKAGQGLEAACQTWDQLARGASSPRNGHVIQLGETG